MTGIILPNKVNTENISKVEVPEQKGTISYLKSKSGGTRKPAEKGAASPSRTSPRDSVSSYTSEPGMNGRKVRELVREGGQISQLVSLLVAVQPSVDSAHG